LGYRGPPAASTSCACSTLLARRDVILALLDARIARRSEAAVVYTQPL
jgi:hypothetical protein